MFTIAKEFTFDAAHLLDGYDGKCNNLHGHTYKLQVEVTDKLTQEGPKKSMVIDFSILKDLTKKFILDKFDHAFLYDKTNARESAIAQILIDSNSKVFGFTTRTTAEELAAFIFHTLKNEAGLPIKKIRLWETPTSFCEYE